MAGNCAIGEKMRITIGTRIWLGTLVAVAALMAFTAVRLWNIERARQVEELVDRSQTIVLHATKLLSELKDAETGQRGFVITGVPEYLDVYKSAIAEAPAEMETLRQLLAQEPEQQSRLERLEPLIADKFAELAQTIELRRTQGAAAAAAVVTEDRGKALMDRMRLLLGQMMSSQEGLMGERQAELERIENETTQITVIGVGVIVLILLIGAAQTIAMIRRPLRLMIEDAARIGSGQFDHRIAVTRQDELGDLTAHFNKMAGMLSEVRKTRVSAEKDLLVLNHELKRRAEQLEHSTRVINLLRKMSHRLQSCVSDDEVAAVLEAFAPQITGTHPGAFFLYNNSRTLLQMKAGWNGRCESQPDFMPDDCWALRRGQLHVVQNNGAELVCAHMAQAAGVDYVCMPLTSRGNVLGLLHFEGGKTADTAMPQGFDLELETALAENVALAIANYRLQETLRLQSVRDPLTGLFNRRYLEETLDLELARAVRSSGTVAVIMIDVDRFKQFNDTFGHDAGDFVLRSIGEAFTKNIRLGDFACRYGGEEFAVVMPNASLAVAAARAEQIRQAVKFLANTYRGTTLGPISISLGVALFPDHGVQAQAIVEAADRALYRAKSQGRDRVEVAEVATEVGAPKLEEATGA